jgi:hypothetical protein
LSVSKGCSVTREFASSNSVGEEKSDLRRMRYGALHVVRPSVAPGARSALRRIYLELELRRVDCGKCGAVKRERLGFLLDNVLHTKRFALYVGPRCRSGTIKDVAEELNLDWLR